MQATFDDLQKSVLKDPCLHWVDPKKLMVLSTDFSAKGFGHVVCQPDDNEEFLELVLQFMSGNGFHFLMKKDHSVLYPVAFRGHRPRGNEKFLHLYLGEAFCGDFTMNKYQHMCYGRHFVWVTDCYAVKFILLYDSTNQAILCLQMHLMRWDMDIVHHRNDHLVDADYWSCLDCDLRYDPSFCRYLRLVESFHKTHPDPTKIPIHAQHMPYYQGPCLPNLSSLWDEFHGPLNALDASTDIDYAAASLLTNIVTSCKLGFTSLSHRPVKLRSFAQSDRSPMTPPARELYNLEFPAFAYFTTNFPWAVYGFNSGHFVSSFKQQNLQFSIE